MQTNSIVALVNKRKRFIFNVSLVLSIIFAFVFAFVLIHDAWVLKISNTILSISATVILLYNLKTRYKYMKKSATVFLFIAFASFVAAVIFSPTDPFAAVWFIYLILMAFLIIGNVIGISMFVLTIGSLVVLNYFGLLENISNAMPTVYVSMIIAVAFGLFINNTIKQNEEFLAQKNLSLEHEVNERTKELYDLLHFDTLTKLPNRHALNEHIDVHEVAALLIVDIKHFSQINDTFSMSVGDMILQTVAKRLEALHISNSSLYRLDSDRFVLLYDKLEDISTHIQSVQTFIDDFDKEPITVDVGYSMQEFTVNVSASFASQSKNNILQSASLALKYAKSIDETFIVYDESLGLEEKITQSMKNLSMIKQAIAEDRVVPVFQKIEHKHFNYYESLVRIKEGDKLISPFFFLEDAKKTNNYHTITRIMIDKTFEYFKDRDAKFSINLSYIDIVCEDTIAHIRQKLSSAPNAKNAVFELLESEDLSNMQHINNFQKLIKEYGASLAIDDFGSGYSNFHYLADIQPDILKIDGSIIKHIATDQRYKLIAKNIVNFAHDQNIMVVAEFIHDQATLLTAKSLGVDAFQGFHIAQPMLEV